MFWLHKSTGCMRKFTETQYKVKKRFCSSSCVGVFQDNIVDWCVKDFRYTIMQSQIQLGSIAMAPVWGRMVCILLVVAGRSATWWVNTCVSQFSFWSNFMKMTNFFLKFLSVVWEFWILAYWIIKGSLYPLFLSSYICIQRPAKLVY
jgi:hypothetical protein